MWFSNSALLIFLPAVLAGPAAPASTCNRDNCLRNLIDSKFSTQASSFCSGYITATGPVTSTIPTYLSGCNNSPSRVSSACSCIATPTGTPSPSNGWLTSEEIAYRQANWVGGVFGSPYIAPANPGAQDLPRPYYRAGGSGLYTANSTSDPTISNHTIYRPNTAPGFKMPVVVWANGGCIFAGLRFAEFLQEIASHGYFVIANGPAEFFGPGSATRVTDLKASLDWITEGKDAGRYGQLDKNKIVVAGQSCGGLEAYSASWKDERVKMTMIFNSGILNSTRIALLSDLNKPIAYFLGGPGDIAYANGERDYLNLPEGLPVLKGNLDVGHGGTYADPNGGRFGKVARAWLDWHFKGDNKSRDLLTKPSSPYIADGWSFVNKNLDKLPKLPENNYCSYF